MAEELVFAAVFGLSAGFGPGPLLTLVISQSLRYGTREGIKVAVAPLVTDAPIAVLSLLVLQRVRDADAILGIVSLVGAVVLVYIGVKEIRSGPIGGCEPATRPRSLLRGAVVNALNPHPYIGWIAILGPKTVRLADTGTSAAVLFVAVFYVLLVGSKAALAAAAGRAQAFVGGRVYVWVVRGLGALLCLFAVFLIRDAVRLLGGE